ncbi:MAG: heavy metal-binding domain-containing protein [Acidobacteriota bacterium]
MGVLGLSFMAVLVANEAIYKGTISAVDKARVQVRTIDDAGKPSLTPEWFAVTAKTKVVRGTTAVTFATARIKTGERATVVVGAGDEAGVEWVCLMHPETPRAAAGACPICSMTLKSRARPAKAAEIRLEAQ